MEEYSNLIGLGIIGAVVLIVGAIVSFLLRKKGGKEKSGKAVNYKSQASMAMDDGAASFKDGNLYDMKEEEESVYKDSEKQKKDDGKMESWKQYE
ncbi:MAG: hypothetical protein QGI63_08435 [Rhodospirillales bacterium]|jgi:hypothetical protein|nr:hypothetical protein [Rhodospirillales bacterium]MDP6774282.1 hypothetical protein [Rhodospirillales bacterium]|tara:strand:+ start:379 stop:663 length:285 start_codon:yes stop_codon:yes gene_type:complete